MSNACIAHDASCTSARRTLRCSWTSFACPSNSLSNVMNCDSRYFLSMYCGVSLGLTHGDMCSTAGYFVSFVQYSVLGLNGVMHRSPCCVIRALAWRNGIYQSLSAFAIPSMLTPTSARHSVVSLAAKHDGHTVFDMRSLSSTCWTAPTSSLTLMCACAHPMSRRIFGYWT